jgi:hypothetical protein
MVNRVDNGELDQDDGLDDFRRTDRRSVITAAGSCTSKEVSHRSTKLIWLHSGSKIVCRKCQKLECLLQDERMKSEMTDEAQLKWRGELKTYKNITCFIVLLGWSLAQVVVAPSRRTGG